MAPGAIMIGIGGWDFDPWRGSFYPEGLPKTRQLAFAAKRLTSIEINATYYRLQKPATFEKWAKAVPDGFRFAVKASRFCTNRKRLADAGEAIEKFLAQGIAALGDRLGPILWQFMPTKQFDADDFAGFLALLPGKQDGVPLRHALEVRHDSFRDAAFFALARKTNAAIVFADSDEFSEIEVVTADFRYARLQRAVEGCATGYDDAGLDDWAKKARRWAAGDRDSYVFFIAGAKIRNPAAAMALIGRL